MYQSNLTSKGLFNTNETLKGNRRLDEFKLCFVTSPKEVNSARKSNLITNTEVYNFALTFFGIKEKFWYGPYIVLILQRLNNWSCWSSTISVSPWEAIAQASNQKCRNKQSKGHKAFKL